MTYRRDRSAARRVNGLQLNIDHEAFKTLNNIGHGKSKLQAMLVTLNRLAFMPIVTGLLSCGKAPAC